MLITRRYAHIGSSDAYKKLRGEQRFSLLYTVGEEGKNAISARARVGFHRAIFVDWSARGLFENAICLSISFVTKCNWKCDLISRAERDLLLHTVYPWIPLHFLQTPINFVSSNFSKSCELLFASIIELRGRGDKCLINESQCLLIRMYIFVFLLIRSLFFYITRNFICTCIRF